MAQSWGFWFYHIPRVKHITDVEFYDSSVPTISPYCNFHALEGTCGWGRWSLCALCHELLLTNPAWPSPVLCPAPCSAIAWKNPSQLPSSLCWQGTFLALLGKAVSSHLILHFTYLFTDPAIQIFSHLSNLGSKTLFKWRSALNHPYNPHTWYTLLWP